MAATALFLLGASSWHAADVARADVDQLQPFTRQDVVPAAGVNFVRVGDLDGDGMVDFAGLDSDEDRGTGNITSSKLQWWRQEDPAGGEPGSAFSGKIDVRGSPLDPDLLMGVGDLDGDGHLDLLTVEPNGQVGTWLNTDGSAKFPGRKSGGRVLTGAGHIEIANLDADSGDRRDDLLVLRDGRDVTWYPSEGEAGAIDLGKPETILRGSDARQIASVTTGDLNGDGLLDLATSMNRTGGEVAWFLQRLDGEDRIFERAGKGTEDNVRDLTIGDIDGDGDEDILVSSQVGNRAYDVFAWLNPGDGTALQRQAAPLQTGETKNHKWNSIDIADVNGDGALDFIASEFTQGNGGGDGHLCWYQNPGAPAPTEVPTAQPTPLPSATLPGSTPPSATPPGATPPPGTTPPPDATPLPSATPPAGTPPGFEPIVTIHLPFASRQ